jgi:hypothetical protein
VELAGVPGEEGGGEILLYPAMLEKKIVVSVDLLIIVPLVFLAAPASEADSEDTVRINIDPDLGGKDLFQRAGPDDNEYFDMVTSFGFNVNLKSMGLNSGQLFLENKTDAEDQQYELPVFDFAEPRNSLSLDGAEMEKIKKIWPFIPRASIRFERGEKIEIGRGFNIELQSMSVRVGGEFTFETGL